MIINFEDEYLAIVCGDGIIIELDRETALDLAKRVQDFYQDGFEEDNEEEYDYE